MDDKKRNTMSVSELARIAGSTKTPKKAMSSRANGKLGGRPKKVLVPNVLPGSSGEGALQGSLGTVEVQES
jgi:hypothetical protein